MPSSSKSPRAESLLFCPRGGQSPPPHTPEGQVTFISLLMVFPALDVIILGGDRGTGERKGPSYSSGSAEETRMGGAWTTLSTHQGTAHNLPTCNTLEPIPVFPHGTSHPTLVAGWGRGLDCTHFYFLKTERRGVHRKRAEERRQTDRLDFEAHPQTTRPGHPWSTLIVIRV